PGRPLHPQAPARRRRSQEARLHREVHPAGRDRPAADPRALGRAARQDRHRSRGHPRAQQEGVGMAVRKKKATKDATPLAAKAVKTTDTAAKRRNEELDKLTVDCIKTTAKDVHQEIGKHKKPDLAFPVRSLGNVKYSLDRGYFEIGRQKKTRTLTVNTVKSF